MSASPGADVPLQRPDIAASWLRSARAGLRPDAALDRLPQREVDARSRLVAAAEPVLDRLAAQLEGTRYCVLLADRAARIVQRRFGLSAVGAALDGISAVPGTVFDESATGTNSIATVLELRRGVRVAGDEHYLEAMRAFTCYGHPIVNPLTRRLEGVLDLTGPVEDTNDLLAPFLTAAAQEIESRLLLGARAAQQHLLAAFQTASAHTSDAVLVLGEGVCLTNPSATSSLGPQDHVVLRALAEDGVTEVATTRLTLASGREASVRLSRVAGGGDGVLVRVALAGGGRTRGPGSAPRHRGALDVLVLGEAGSGRTTAALDAAADALPRVVDVRDGGPFVEEVERALGARASIVVENLHAADGSALARLRQVATRATSGRVVATADTGVSGTGEWSAVTSCFRQVHELRPLRDRAAELPAILERMLQELEPGSARRFSPELLEVLLRQPWPGNLHELRGVLREVLRQSGFSTLGCAHLPPAYRQRDGGRRRTPLEDAERAAIVRALEECGGNKVATARMLGISRVTLYSRIRSLGILA